MGIIRFSLQYLPFVLCCSLLQRIISSRSKRAATSSEQKVFVRTVPKHSLTVCCLFTLSLSLSVTLLLFWNFVTTILWIGKIQSNWNFFFGKNPKHLNFFCVELSPELVCQKGDSFSMYLSTICVGWNYLQCMILSSILSSLPLMLSKMSVFGGVFLN